MPENLTHYLHLPKFAEKKLKKLSWNYFSWVYKRLDIITTPTKTAAKLIENLGITRTEMPKDDGGWLDGAEEESDALLEVINS